MSRVLIVVDVQNDFCEGGSLAVAGGAATAARITRTMRSAEDQWDHVVGTRDWHIDPGDHFSERPDFVRSWPVHCVAGAWGADLHPNLDETRLEAIFDKGAHQAAYSGFEGVHDDVPLADWLRERSVSDVDVVGIATDHCVRATALDAAREGFAVRVLLDRTAGVAAETVDQALEALRAAGVELVGEPVAPR